MVDSCNAPIFGAQRAGEFRRGLQTATERDKLHMAWRVGATVAVVWGRSGGLLAWAVWWGAMRTIKTGNEGGSPG